MENIKDFDLLLLNLDRQIADNPSKKWRIILQTVREIECPYLKRRIKGIYYKNDY
ncbi:MAG: hypothetical protein AAGI07_11235 [Bacteroidota bacterium]